MLNRIWPIIIIVASNCFYNICTKSTPAGINAFCALVVTYLTSAVITFALFICEVKPENAFLELSKINWSSFILGIAIVGLEIGYILLYRAGWKLSSGALVANICLAFALIFIGSLLYKEQITLRQILGIGFCVAGLVLVGK
ncbi:MAG: EamA family transporter [Fretibacterium sp.]|nr:EamA family transporter [Fretibacterium sp.]